MANLSNINNKFIVEDSGDVGIGVTAATSKLHLRDPGVNSDVGIKIGNDSRDWNLQVMGSISDSFQIFTHDNSNIMTILPSGNVGIGVTGPVGKIHVGLPAYTNEDTNSQQAIFGASNGYGVRIGYNETDNKGYINVLKPGVAWGSLILQEDIGNVGIGTDSPVAPLQIERASNTTLALSNSGSVTSGTRGEIAVYNSSVSTCAAIKAVVDTSATADNVGTDLTFFTRAIGGSLTQKMVINGSGEVRAQRSRSNTVGDMALSVDPGDTVVRYGWRVDQTNNSLNLDYSDVPFASTNTNLVTYTATGNVGIGTTSPGALLNLSQANGANIRFDNETTEKYFTIGEGVGTNNVFSFRGNSYRSTDTLSIDFVNDRVGIGTISPSEKLTLQLDAQNQAFSGKNGTDYLWFLRNEAGAGARQSGRFQLMDTDVTTVNIESASNRNTYFNAGNVGIGATDPVKTLDVRGQLAISNSASSYWYLDRNDSTGNFEILTDTNSSVFNIDTSGNVGIGGTPSTFANFTNVTIQGGSSGSNLDFKNSSGTRVSAIVSTPSLLSIETNTTTPIIFKTNDTERMAITSGGALRLTNEIATNSKSIDFTNTAGTTGWAIGNGITAAAHQFVIYDNTAGLERMRITSGGTVNPGGDNTQNLGSSGTRWSVVYSANGVNTSDETLKENIKECDLGIDFINTLKPKSYNFKNLDKNHQDYGKKHYGLIAQDLKDGLLKDSVDGEKDGEYGLMYNDLIAPMIKAIQELKTDNDTLKARIETLENK